METKELIINGVVYAKYQIDSKSLFLKIIVQIVEGDIKRSEHLTEIIISLIEKTNFNFIGFLNI